MAHQERPYTTGYEAAYQKIYAMINSENHQQDCGNCRPCGVIQEVIEVLMKTLAGKLTQDEFYTVAILLARTGTGVKDRNGNIRIDWWGEFNNAVNDDGSYDWPGEGCDV